MQTISVPYHSSGPDETFLIELRRIYSAAVRTAYANASEGGVSLKQKDLRDLVKRRFAGGVADAWLLHCATLEGMDLRRARPDGRMVFGTRASLERRQKGLIGQETWRRMRLRPLCSRGDRLYKGNRHFRLSADGQSCIFRMYGRSVLLDLTIMKGLAGKVLRQVALLASEKKINVMFRLDDEKIHVTFDPEDLPDHPQRRLPVRPLAGRCLGIDLNPNWIGMAVAANLDDPSILSATSLLEHALVKLDLPIDASPELVRETLAAVADRAIGLARKHRCGTIVLEKGLGKLRSRGKNRSLNRLLNYWARTIFVQMLTRRARLAGIQVIEVWGGYSSTIGNLAYEAPDACAAACEIARRGIARLAKAKDVLPVYEEGCVSRLWKNGEVPAELKSWRDAHRSIKAAKIGYRRPHPDRPQGWRDTDATTLASDGHAVVRLRRHHRPGLLFRPMASPKPDAIVRNLSVQRRRAPAQLPSTSKVG